MKNVILLLTNKNSETVYEQYEKLKRELSEEKYDVFILFHSSGDVPCEISTKNNFVFTDKILIEEGFIPIANSLLPGSNHFPVLKFREIHPMYEFYWVIEDDVRFTGNWQDFFGACDKHDLDFLAAHMKNVPENRSWFWKNFIFSPFEKLVDEEKVYSFNPVYRLKNSASEFISEMLRKGWKGHHEILIPTLLKKSGMKIADFSGNGKYTLPDLRNKFYDSVSHEWEVKYDTMHPDLIYHPVKDFK